MPLSTFIVVLCVIVVVAFVFVTRRGGQPPLADPPRLLDGFAGSGASSGGYSVAMTDAGQRKIQVIRALRCLTGVTLIQAKNFIDHPGSAIERMSDDVAQRVAAALQAAGATVELRGPDA